MVPARWLRRPRVEEVMMRGVALVWIITGLVKLAPVVGCISEAWLRRLYGDLAMSYDVVILLRHRALYLGMIGALIVCAGFSPPLRPVALAFGLISMISFIALVVQSSALSSPALHRIAWIDGALALCLIAAMLYELYVRGGAHIERVM